MNTKTAQKKPFPYHRDGLEEELLRHAAKIVTAQGVEALSMRELGRAANVSRAAPYHYFPSKGALLTRIGERGFARLAQRILAAASVSKDPATRLRLGFQGYLEFALDEPDSFRMMFANVLDRTLLLSAKPGQPPAAFSSVAAMEALKIMLDGVDAWMDTRKRDKRDRIMVANMFWSFAHGVASLALHRNLKHAEATAVFNAGFDALLG